MKKEDLARQIAEDAYNVGFGAKRNFATYDIINLIPSFLTFITLVVGIFALHIEVLNTKIISTFLILLSIVGIYASGFSEDREKYNQVGKKSTEMFGKLKNLYYEAQNDEADCAKLNEERSKIMNEFYSMSISRQALFSSLLAHYKFFWEWRKNIAWVDKELNLSFFWDKLPISIYFFMVLLILLCLICYFWSGINAFFNL